MKIGCNVNYHHNYRVFQGQRIYYDRVGLPDIVQIGEHQFAERKLINTWILMMVLSWTSATNCARIYNTGLASMNNSDSAQSEPIDWQFKLEVTSDEVYDAFTILSLLEDCQLQRSTLVVPHGGLAKDRFTTAVQTRNNCFRLCSQPELLHYCKKCTRFYPGIFFNHLISHKTLIEIIYRQKSVSCCD
jgi:KDZ transposase family protein